METFYLKIELKLQGEKNLIPISDNVTEDILIFSPGTYPSDPVFSKKRSVVVVCTPNPLAICCQCGVKIPEGCFWRNFREKRDLCRPCMTQEICLKKPRRVMMRFKKIRELQGFVVR